MEQALLPVLVPVQVQPDRASQPVGLRLEPPQGTVEGKGAQPIHPEGHRLLLLIQDGLQLRVKARLGQVQQEQPRPVL